MGITWIKQKKLKTSHLIVFHYWKKPPKTVGYDYFLAVYIGTGVAAGIVIIIVVLVLAYFIMARKK